MTICLCYSSYHFEGKGYFDPAIYIYPTSDNVPRSYLEEKEMECMAKDETIRVIIFISVTLGNHNTSLVDQCSSLGAALFLFHSFTILH